MSQSPKMTKYLNYISANDETSAANWIETLTHAERITLRTELEASDCRHMLRNLYFDYEKQCWIDAETIINQTLKERGVL